ncbi:MAG: sigma-54 interaction domain-containing protein [Acidobacteriota bacterium]
MNDPDARFFSRIFNDIPHGIFTVDQEGHVTSFNRTAEEITGWRREEVLGRRCTEVFLSNHCDAHCFLRASIAEGEAHHDRQVTITTRDGRRLEISVTTAAVTDDSGSVVGGVEMFRDLSAVASLRRQVEASYTHEDIVSRSPAMRSVRDILPLVARSDSTVLIQGEPGTGKELIARAIHNLGPRARKPFVPLNCGALPDTLVESELFGYLRGAFTDARKDKPGLLSSAQGGTLFLDEVGELSPAMQVKLLRVLQEREFTPLGSVRPVRLDVRVLAATNRDLQDDVTGGRFRQDLFFRLNVVSVFLPPLRSRPEDIPHLIQHFVRRFSTLQGRRINGVSERAMAGLMAHTYPGNVRELENAIEHAFVVCGGSVIELEDLPPHLASAAPRPAAADARAMAPLAAAEAGTIRAALERHGGHRGAAARDLGVSRNTLWRKMRAYGIE